MYPTRPPSTPEGAGWFQRGTSAKVARKNEIRGMNAEIFAVRISVNFAFLENRGLLFRENPRKSVIFAAETINDVLRDERITYRE